MLVALSIIAIAALTLVRLDAYAVRSAGDLDESTVAGIVAQNRAVDLWTDPAPPTIGASISRVANADRPHDVFGRDFAILEHQLGGVGAAHPHLVELLREIGRAHV